MWADRALAMPGAADHPRERASALEAAGGIAYWQFDTEAIARLYGEALDAARAEGDPALIANAAYNMSFTFQDESAEARAYLEESLALYEQLGDDAGISKAHWGLANQDLLRPDMESGRAHLKISLELARKAGDDFQTGWTLFMLGAADLRVDEQAGARHFKDALRIFAEVEDVTGIVFNLEGLATLALQNGDARRGVTLAAAATVLRAESGTVLTDPEEEARFLRLAESLDQAEIERIQAEAQGMSRDELIAFALEEDYQASNP
jgi:hypothetical protein